MRNRKCIPINPVTVGLNLFVLFVFCISIVLSGCSKDETVLEINHGALQIAFNNKMFSRISTTEEIKFPLMTSFLATEYIETDAGKITQFKISAVNQNIVEDKPGQGKRYILIGVSDSAEIQIRKETEVILWDNFPGFAQYKVTYQNLSSQPVKIKKWVNHNYQIESRADSIPFWSFQSGSYEARPDWVLPVRPGFYQQNYMGMNASDYGGGTPVTDVWRTDAGVAVGHLESVPKLVSLPVKMDSMSNSVQVRIEYEKPYNLEPGESLQTFTTFVAVHSGDFYNVLTQFSRLMQIQTSEMKPLPQTVYEPMWCAWGYERDFTVKQVLETLPKVKELGFDWAVLDDGWQTAEGDWFIDRKKFTDGVNGMRNFVTAIHQQGLKAKLWWAPLAVDPETELIKNHPDLLLINQDGKTQDITWWDSYYLCPAYEGTLIYARDLVVKFIRDWGFDGLKIDGQHLNAVPPCYNPEHHHAYPEESVEKLPAFWATIYKTAISLKPESVIEICPCGTAASFFNMLQINQSVASDPLSSWQIRSKGKTYKALMGAQASYSGDHVELSDKGNDFASTLGIGGVIETKFTWPQAQNLKPEYVLTPEKEAIWKKWVAIYRTLMLPQGIYHGELYDIGYDRPETHVIEKDGKYFFAFYADQFSGQLELRGLAPGKYSIIDYVNAREVARIVTENPRFTAGFNNYLLVVAQKAE